MKSTMALATAMVALILAAEAIGKSVVREFSGQTSMTTTAFVVESPWLLDWHLNGDYEQLVALDITLIDSKTGRHVGRVLHTKRKGNGLKLFNEGGAYKLRISSTLARWRIRIEQITPEEADQYTPRKQDTKPFQLKP